MIQWIYNFLSIYARLCFSAMQGRGSLWEVALLFLLLGNVFMRRLPQVWILIYVCII